MENGWRNWKNERKVIEIVFNRNHPSLVVPGNIAAVPTKHFSVPRENGMLFRQCKAFKTGVFTKCNGMNETTSF